MKTVTFSIIVFLCLITSTISCKKQDDPYDELLKYLTKDNKITINGTVRDYDLFVPENSNNPSLVVLLHGHGSSSDDLTGESGHKAPYKRWMSIADQNNLVLLIPNGTTGTDDKSGWNDCRADGTGNPDIDDVTFLEQTINSLIYKYSINENKIYVVGTSNGGFMTMRLAQEIPQRMTAAAVIVATMPNNSECTASTSPVSVLFMNGTEDPLVPYNGGQVASNRGDVMSSEEAISYWVNRNQTDTVPEHEKLNNINSKDESTVEKYTYSNGTNNTQVVLYKVIGGGHTEPSILEQYSEIAKIVLGEQNFDIEMADEIWEFFKDKKK